MTICIFCDSEFEATGVGEHVVPECAGGSALRPYIKKLSI